MHEDQFSYIDDISGIASSTSQCRMMLAVGLMLNYIANVSCRQTEGRKKGWTLDLTLDGTNLTHGEGSSCHSYVRWLKCPWRRFASSRGKSGQK